MITRKLNDSRLELTNAGQLSLFFIGTGSAFSKINFQTNLMLIKGDEHILVDCGSLCPYALETTYNRRVADIKNLILTHPHSDHIGGVEELVLVGRYVADHKINILVNDEFKQKLWDESLRGGIQYSEEGAMTFDSYFDQYKPVLINKYPFEIYEADFKGFNIKFFRTLHVTTIPGSYENAQFSQGLIIDNKVLFTADTQFNPDQLTWLMQHYKGIEFIFHDCDVSGYSEGVHASYRQLKTLPTEIKAKMYLCHYNSHAQRVSPIEDGFLGFTQPGIYYDFD
ncbi:MAG: MBL fold metallo-hydrolase [Treponema sp.]|nr:MBL fold metallo-hydrolase [Treponema sp.]